MTLYGLHVIQHHSANRVMTVMSPSGIEAARRFMSDTEGLEVRQGSGRLTQYVEQVAGALDALVERYRIEVLSFAEWQAKKAALGERWR